VIRRFGRDILDLWRVTIEVIASRAGGVGERMVILMVLIFYGAASGVGGLGRVREVRGRGSGGGVCERRKEGTWFNTHRSFINGRSGREI
jgi:hypothetical protein